MPKSLQDEGEHIEFRLPNPADDFSLSPIEIEILQHIADGNSAKKISRHHNQTLYGIYNSLFRMKCKLKAKNLKHAVAIGIRSGIIR